MIRAVVFDFDGTLTELTLNFTDMRKEVEEIAAKYVPREAVRELDGFYIIEMIYELERSAGREGRSFREEAFRKLRDLEVEAADGKQVYPYTRSVLRALRDRGIGIGVMTRNCMGALTKVFPDIEQYVDTIVTREDVPRVKPDPAHAAEVLTRLHAEPSEALLVGDHPTDILAGKTLNAGTVAVLTGRTGKNEFLKVGADQVVNDIRDVLRLLPEPSSASLLE